MEKKEACGLFGITNHQQAFHLTTLGLFALQHRGEEAAGIATSNGEKIFLKSGLGKVDKVFAKNKFDPTTLANLLGSNQAIGHTRYSITGKPTIQNVQPLVIDHLKGKFALAHNGNLTNSKEIRESLEKKGSVFQTTMDSEVILHLILKSKAITLKEAIVDAVRKIKGAYSLLIMTKDTIYAVRDPHGFRPLCLGTVNGSMVVASETCALDLMGARYMGQVDAGTIVTIKKGKITEDAIFSTSNNISRCIFEMIYFSRPDSLIFGDSVYDFRKTTGKILAEESPVDADLVVPIPDSGNYAALGYAEKLNIPFELAITKNHYFGRSFIQPQQSDRDFTVKLKLNPIKNVIHKKKIILVDDSIVRGTTTRKKIKALRSVGAKEIHLRIASPPIKHPCYFGIDFPDRKKLIANNKTLKEITDFLEVDSLAYLSLDGLLKSTKQLGYCTACFSGKYPLKVKGSYSKEELELFN